MARCPLSGGLLPWHQRHGVAMFAVILSFWLEGCEEKQTCYPDDSASDTGEYSCVSNRYCSLQDRAIQLDEAMSLQECMDECKARDCQVIQYDCGTHCWLLDSCGSHVTSGCESSIYYRNLDWVDTAATTTTTTTTTTVSVELGSCFPNTVDSGQYSCTAKRYCVNQDSAAHTGTKTLQSCIDECNADSNCVSIQYDCSTDCRLFTNGQVCGTELETVCGSSLYYKQSTNVVTTTGPNTPGACFPGTVDTGSYACSSAKYCGNQGSALELGTMSLTACFAECDQRSSCSAVQYDCNTDCWLMVDTTCGTEQDTSCGSSVYYKASNTLSTSVAQAPVGTTIPQGGGNCFPVVGDNGLFNCQPESYCSNQADALQLGTMSLEACMKQCFLYDCGAIQYDCNTDCWLLRTCDSYVTTSCGSSVYLPDALGWPASTTSTTTVFGACFPATNVSYDFNDFTCQAAVYCSNQALAGMYGAMTIHQCAEMCRHNASCSAIQYDCNTDCYLLSDCGNLLQSVCGSSVYVKDVTAASAPGSTYQLADGHTFITYSATSCSFDDCLVTATCPTGSSPIECATIPPQSGDGAYQGTWGGSSGAIAGAGDSCEAKGSSSGTVMIAQATCSDLVQTHFEGTTMSTGALTVQCFDGSAVSCNCWTAWEVSEICEGQGTFAPTITAGNPPRCEKTMNILAPTRRGGISAVCAKGRYSASYLWSSTVIKSDDSLQWCGWASNVFSQTDSVSEADCTAWFGGLPGGSCESTECPDLAVCERICSRCGQCRGFLHSIVLGASMQGAFMCRFLTDSPASGGIISIADTPPDVVTFGSNSLVFYANSRHTSCSRMASISRASLFSDKGCTTMVQPTSVQDSLGNQISSHWSSASTYNPGCLPNCLIEDTFFKADFPVTTGVLCAILHSTDDLSTGWQIRLNANGGVDSGGTFVPSASSLLAKSDYGTAVSFTTSPNLVKGTEVVFAGTLSIACTALPGFPTACRNGDPSLWRLDVASALAHMLALEQHMVHVTSSRRLGQSRRLQSPMTFPVSIRFFVDTPRLAALSKSVAAQLSDMREQSSLFNATLNTLIPSAGMILDVLSMSTFSVSEQAPTYSALPVPTTSSTAAQTVATTAAPAPTSAPTTTTGEEDTVGIILGIVFGSVGFLTVVSIIYVMCRKKKKATHPAPTPAAPPPVSSSGPAAVTVRGKAELLYDNDDGLAPLSPKAYDSLPEYWNARKDLNPTFEMEFDKANAEHLRFDDLMYVSHREMAQFQDLVSKTYKDIVTQDRLCPNKTHDKTRGGCPCVQVGGTPGLPSDFQVKRVIRVEESAMFNRYVARRDEIKRKRMDGDKCEVPDPPFFTRDWMSKHPNSELCKLDDSINEVYLWHGTQVRVGLQIAMNDFKLEFAGSGAGTMYGKGLYFTESSTKADEYARDEPGGHYDGIRALLLCRVCVGKYYYTQGREPTAIDKYTAGESDSTLGDRAKSVNTYREIVVYDEDQVYPEYLVIYERLHGGARSLPPRKDLPFQLELPLYWKTVGKNPYQEGFRKHRVVKEEIQQLFQRLAEGTCRSTVKVERVRRVEDSSLWCRYMNWKRNLSQSLLEEGDKIKPPNELDGNPASGHVLTEKILAENRGDHAISVENMQPGLNEMLLWHGTSKSAAEQIAEEGFLVGDAKHGRRFGNGVYLAEDLTKSLDYCQTHNGVSYVLLCRATCGHIHYTEKNWDSGADEVAKRAGCSCVLANPEKKGPREYILFDQSQVYPEYIVEMRRS